MSVLDGGGISGCRPHSSRLAPWYLSTLAVNHAEAEDSLWYLRSITYGTLKDQFHPNHLIYNFVVRAFFRAWQWLGYTRDAELPAQILNVLGGVAALWVVSLLARRLGFPRLSALALLTIAFSYGFWWYSVECETYILPTLFVLLSIHQLLLIQADFQNTRRHVLLGVWTALAVLFHQQHALIVPVVGIGYLWLLRSRPSRWLRQVLVYGVVTGVLIAGSYAFVAVVVEGRSDFQGIVAWLLSGGRAGGYGYGLSVGSLKAVLGFGRAAIGAHFLLGFPSVSEFIHTAVPNYSVAKFIYLVRNQSPAMRALLLALTLTAVLAWTAVAVRLVQYRRRASGLPPGPGNRTHSTSALSCWSPICLCTGSSTSGTCLRALRCGSPSCLSGSWRLGCSCAIWPISHAAVRLLLGAGVVCLFLVNLLGSVLPQTNRGNDYWFQANRWLIENAGPGDLIVSGSGYGADGYLAFYARSRVLATSSTDRQIAERLDKAMRAYAPPRVLVSSTVYAPLGDVPAREPASSDPASAFFDSILPRLTLLHADSWQEVYLLR